MSDPSLISHITRDPSLRVSLLLAYPRKPTALCQILHQLPLILIQFHQDAFKQPPYAIAVPAFLARA